MENGQFAGNFPGKTSIAMFDTIFSNGHFQQEMEQLTINGHFHYSYIKLPEGISHEFIIKLPVNHHQTRGNRHDKW